jgi:hypothetical protein
LQYGFGRNLVAEVRYVGNHTSSLYQALNQNPTLLPLALDFPSYVSPGSLCQDENAPGFGTRDCNVGPFQGAVGNTGFSIYNSLQTNVTTRNFHGLTGTITYTWSRTIDNASEILPTGAGGATLEFAQNPLNTNVGERGVAGQSYPNVASFGLVYEVPFFAHRNDLAGKLLGGFSINTIYGYNSGQPFTPFQFIANAYCDATFNAAVLGVDTCRPILSNPKAPIAAVAVYDNGQDGGASGGAGLYVLNATDQNGVLNQPTSKDQVHWILNTDQYAKLIGNPFPGVGRNTLRGQPFNNLDASIYKTTRLSERISLQLQFNSFNVLNHAYLGTPNALIDSSQPGLAVNPFLTTAYNSGSGLFPARAVQLGGKIIF